MTPPSQAGCAAPVTRAVPARRHQLASVPVRFASVIDSYVFVWRAGQVFLLRRAGEVYASGQLCLPSRHLERDDRDRAMFLRRQGSDR
jgi:hypothetical protein